ncbi:MAG: hypothetical protein PHF84_10335 [bacterium]|nr:hypothetical protein [bacterium]
MTPELKKIFTDMKISILFTLFFLGLSCSCPAYTSEDGFFPNNDAGVIYLDTSIIHELSGPVTYNGTGWTLDLGFNIGRLFHDYLHLAPYAGIRVLGNLKYKNAFLRDFAENYSELTQEEQEENDFLLSEVDKVANFIKGGKLDGAFGFSFGIVLRPPVRYFPPLKIYRLIYWSSIKPSSDGGAVIIIGGSHGPAYTLDRAGWGFELITFPGYSMGFRYPGTGSLNIGYISLYVEIMDFIDDVLIWSSNLAEYKDQYLKDYVTDKFKDKYRTEIRMGMKIGINIL